MGLTTSATLPVSTGHASVHWPGSPADGALFHPASAALPASIFAIPPVSWRGAAVAVPLSVLDGTPDGAAARVFAAPDADRRRDPRQADTALSTAHIGNLDDAAALGTLWGRLIAAGGARAAVLSRFDRVPDWSRATLLAALRAAAGDAVLIADPAGLPPGGLPSLRGVDAVICPLSDWNGRDSWFAARLDELRAVAAPVALALPETPDAARTRLLAAALALPWIGMDAPPPGPREIALRTATVLSAPDAPVLVTLLTDGDPRQSTEAALHLVNPDAAAAAAVDPASFLPRLGGLFAPFADDAGADLLPGVAVRLAPASAQVWASSRLADRPGMALGVETARRAAAVPRVAIEAVTPAVDSGAFAVKRLAGETVTIEADLICDGHDKLSGAVQWRGPLHEAADWREVAMRPLGNDRWQAHFPLPAVGLYEFRVLAWRDAFETFRDEVAKKHQAGVPTALELREGTAQVQAARTRHDGTGIGAELADLLARIEASDEDARRGILLSPALAAAMRRADRRPGADTSAAFQVDAERTGAAFASWYEIFPRSMSDDPHRHGTFADVERHLPRIAAMGFDVLYFPPIHPIGKTNRKGPNNTLTPSDADPGSPYAIGDETGGHDALHPELGTLGDFLHLRDAAAAHGLELAIDFAIQCSPDHPWLREHRDWFAWRPDGSIRYAENPPKKYQDIVNVDFYAEAAIPDLWIGLCNVVLFWAENGVRLFRVDNPHTKPFPFWQWLIAEVRARYPDTAFLAEAFTRPKVMNRLAKIGFSQSYTYFTWRNTRGELEEYLTQLTTEAPKEFFRPHFFVNTPDINPTFLQTGGRTSHLIRAALAATLSGLWGVYSGFELCEATPLAPGKEEYLDSEKYELRAWDWQRPGNIVDAVTRLNRIRRRNPTLQRTGGLAFLPSSDPAVIAYEKATDSRDNIVCCFVALDPFGTHDTTIELPLWRSGLPSHAHVEIEDLMSGARFGVDGAQHSLRLTPELPFILWRLILS